VEIHYFELPRDEQQRRLDRRLAAAPHETWPMSERELTEWASRFDIPTAGELDGTEPVSEPPTGFASWHDWMDHRWPR
jgi:hypothetical protein